MTRKKKCVLFSIVVAIIIVISSCYLLLPKDSYDYSFYYYVEICNIGIPVNSSVIVPMPDFQEDEIDWTELLLAESTKRGEMNLAVVNTDYGKGLMINSTGRCIISFNLTIQVPAQDLTMDNENMGNKFYVMNYGNLSTSGSDAKLHFTEKHIVF